MAFLFRQHPSILSPFSGWRGARQTVLPRRWVLTDPARLANPLTLVNELPRESGLILRHYDQANRADLAHALLRAARPRGVPVLIAADWRLALLVGAQGIHLPQWQLCRPALWRRAKADWILTATAHDRRAVTRAGQIGADGVLISPVFPTQSHPEAEGLGPLRFAALARAGAGPAVYALGGVTPARFRRLAPFGAQGWAGIGSFTAP